MAILGFTTVADRVRSDGKFSIYVSVNHKRVTRYITTPYTVTDRKYLKNNKVSGCPGASQINEKLHLILDSLSNKLETLDTQSMDCVQIKDCLTELLSGGAAKPVKDGCDMTIGQLFDLQIEQYKAENKNSSARMYSDSKKAIIKKLGDVPLSLICKEDITFLHNEWLRDGYSPGGIQVKMSRFKSLLNKAQDEEWVNYDIFPFNDYKMPRYRPKELNITEEEFFKIATHRTESKRVAFARDMFLLSFYLCGMNVADLMEIDLSWNMVDYERKKTRDVKQYYRHTRFSIPAQAVPLIEKHVVDGQIQWPTVKRHDDILSYINRGFRLLREEAGIQSKLSSYSARKTFCQFAFELGIDENVIKYCIGQTTGAKNVLYNYMRVMHDSADEAMNRIFQHIEDKMNQWQKNIER